MGDWELRDLSELVHWDRDEDRKCLWFKARMLGGQLQRCSRRLKRNDWDRDALLAIVNAQIGVEILPHVDVLTSLAGLLICPNNHRSEENGINLCRRWVSAWEDRVDEDEDDEDEVIQISVESAYGHDAQGSSTSSRVPEPVTPPIYETSGFEDSGFFEGRDSTSDETPEMPSRPSRADSTSRAEDSPPTPPAPANNPLEIRPAAAEPPLSVQPPLSDLHYLPYPTRSPLALSNDLMDALEADLSYTELARKTLYAFREIATSPFLKIGVTADFERRMAELYACGFETSHVAFRFETNHAVRVERLLQLHLAGERRSETGWSGTHAEWFEVSDERAERVARGWGRWMEGGPYHACDDVEYGSLRQHWRARAGDILLPVTGEDRWMRWLDRYAPEPAPAAEVGEEAEVEDPPLVANVAEDSSDSVLTSPTSTSVPDLSTAQPPPASSAATAPVPTATGTTSSFSHLDLSTTQPHPASSEATPPVPLATSTPPSLSHSAAAAQHQRHAPNLVVQFVVRALQLFLLLSVAGSMSHVQFCAIVLLAVLALPLAGGGAAGYLDPAGWLADVVEGRGGVGGRVGPEGELVDGVSRAWRV